MLLAASKPFSRSVISVRSDTSYTTQGGEQPERFPIYSRLHLPFSSSDELEKPLLFPFRAIGTLAYIHHDHREFNVFIKSSNADSVALIDQIDSHFNVPDEDASPAELHRNEFNLLSDKCKRVKYVRTAAVYAALVDVPSYPDIRVFRVKVLKKCTIPMEDGSYQKKVIAYVMDIGLKVELFETSLFELPESFFFGDFQTQLSLKCRLPDDRLLNGAPFPKLENFNLKDHVEVYVLSEYEPCLAVLGSLTTGPNSIPRELLLHEMDHLCIDPFNRTLSSATFPATVNVYKGWAPTYWTHGSIWTLVSVLSSEDPTKVAVRDVFTSLRFSYLQQAINRSYKKQEYRHAMKVDPSKLFVGSPVIAFYKPLEGYIRGTITNLNDMEGFCDFEALDIPDVIILHAPLKYVFYPSTMLLEVPPQVFNFNIATMQKASDKPLKLFNPLICADISGPVEEMLVPNSVAIMKISEMGAEFEVVFEEDHRSYSKDVRKELACHIAEKKEAKVPALGYDFAESRTTSRATSRASSICSTEDWEYPASDAE